MSTREFLLPRERGAAALVVAISMLVVIGFAALVIDLGAGFNERAQDQSAADTAALAGAGNPLNGVAGIRDAALAYVQDNLDTTYNAADWQTLWETCADPNKGPTFQPVPSPWSAANLDCISIDPVGFVRVRVPDQILSTTFGAVIGSDSIKASASAEALFEGLGVSGVLPFGLANDVGDADHVCLSSGPTGLADDPCTGSDSGNFGTLKGRQFGNPTIPTPTNCTASPLGDTLAVNIAVGLDHWVTLDDDADVTNEVRDQCFNLGVDTLNTDTGFPNNGAEQGLATGPVNGGLTPRLQQGTFAKADRFSYQLDDTPLWSFIDSTLTDTDLSGNIDLSVNIPASCLASGFDNGQTDWNGDGTPDENKSWQHMQVCLDDYVTGGYSSVMFTTDGPGSDAGIEDSPRFGYVPQFWEDDLGNGNSWLHVLRFKAVWLQTTWWKKGNSTKVFNPGEDCSSCTQSSYDMIQLSAFVIPDASLPEGLRGDPPPGTTSVNPYRVELYR
jgi:Flp pilus assembly protein TadG